MFRFGFVCEAEQSRDLPLIETLLAQAKRLRVDPDVISAAEGVLERPVVLSCLAP